MVPMLGPWISGFPGGLWNLTYLDFRTTAVIRFLHGGVVKVKKVELSLKRHLVVCVQKVKCEDGLRTERRRRIPTDPQQLSKVFKKPVFGAPAETNGDSVVAGKVNNKQTLRFRWGKTIIPRVSEVNDQAETLEGHTLEKAISPDLELNIFKAAGTLIIRGSPELCAVEGGGGTRGCTQNNTYYLQNSRYTGTLPPSLNSQRSSLGSQSRLGRPNEAFRPTLLSGTQANWPFLSGK